MKSCRTILGALLVVLLFAPALRARDWYQWRGPEQNGVSRETNLPEKWVADWGQRPVDRARRRDVVADRHERAVSMY
jgi:hypothetical protein